MCENVTYGPLQNSEYIPFQGDQIRKLSLLV